MFKNLSSVLLIFFLAISVSFAGNITLSDSTGNVLATCTTLSGLSLDAQGNAIATVSGCDLDNPTPTSGPDIVLLGNSQNIVRNSTAPTTNNHTDFGNADIDSIQITRTYTIRNNGSASLTVSDVSLSGSNVGDFSVTQQPSGTVSANGGTTTFQVRFDPSAVGLRQATVSVANNVTGKNPYAFAVQGTGTSLDTPTPTSDPGLFSGLWLPPGTTGHFVVDQSMPGGDGAVTYVPGCANQRNYQSTNCLFSAAVREIVNDSEVLVTANVNQIISIRYRPTVTAGQGSRTGWLLVNGQNGGDIKRLTEVSLSTTPGDFSVNAQCRMETSRTGVVRTGSSYCAINANQSIYYLNIRPKEVCSGTACVFKIAENTSDLE